MFSRIATLPFVQVLHEMRDQTDLVWSLNKIFYSDTHESGVLNIITQNIRIQYETLEHKTSHKGQFFAIEMYATSES